MPVTIIAEAGVNHNGSLEMAKEMARVAKECGADIVKYQTAVPELVVSKFAEKAEYQKQTARGARKPEQEPAQQEEIPPCACCGKPLQPAVTAAAGYSSAVR